MLHGVMFILHLYLLNFYGNYFLCKKEKNQREHINCYASGLLNKQVNFTSFTIAVACFVFSVQIVLHRLNYTLL